MRHALLFLAALPLSAALVDPFSQPDYLPQLQAPYTLPVSLDSLQMGFPQNDYSGSNGLVCYLGITNPARPQAVCTTPVDSIGFAFVPQVYVPTLHGSEPTPSVPEPQSLGLAGFGLLAFSWFGWRRR